MKQIQITLPRSEYSYAVTIGQGVVGQCLSDLLENYKQTALFVVTNETIQKLYPDFFRAFVPKGVTIETLSLPDGEGYKQLDTVSQLLDFLAARGANRKSIVIAFGGGVVGDMTGFAAAVFMRGIRYVQIPTTLLSQVDSSIGGKTGVNHQHGKNLIGAFKQPLHTIIDIDFLKTLPPREFVAGYAELIKHGFIRDNELFLNLSAHSLTDLMSTPSRLIDAIYCSCQVKAAIVEEDETEAGIRATLNFGHTLGHFLETVTAYKTMLHGEAVIIGMDFSAWWSFDKKMLTSEEYQTIHTHLKRLGITQRIRAVTREEFIEIVDHDKKSAAEGLRFIGLKSIGEATIVDQVRSHDLWEDYQNYLKTDAFLTTDPT